MGRSDDTGCPLCGADMGVRMGRYGRFYSCERYPDCRGARRMSQPAPRTSLPMPSFPVPYECHPTPARITATPRTMGEVPGYLTALRIALSSCRNTTRAELLATANAPADGRTSVEAWELVNICRHRQNNGDSA